MSPRVYPNSSLGFLSQANFSSWFWSKSKAITTRKVSLELKKEYSKESGRGFRSSEIEKVSQVEIGSFVGSGSDHPGEKTD